jgi:hypothetical protein
MISQPIDLAITLFSGFLQNLGSAGSGLVDLEHKIHQLVYPHSTVKLRLFPWNAKTDDVAESLWRYRRFGQKQQHIIVGYSYGGQAADNFVRSLERRNETEVHSLVLCDPVRRFKYLPGVAGFFGWGRFKYRTDKIHIDDVKVFVQQNRRFQRRVGPFYQPAGHPVLLDNEKLDCVICKAEHSYIDNHAAFHQYVIQRVTSALQEIKNG